MSFTYAQVCAAINGAVGDIQERADLPDSGVIDALNLVLNVVVYRLDGNPDASIDAVIEANYDTAPDEVISWFS